MSGSHLVKAMDPVRRFHGPGPRHRGPSSPLFFRKIIPLILEIPRPRYFYKNTPKLFQNYILVPIFLHIGPFHMKTCKLMWNGVRPCLTRQTRMLFSSKQQRRAEQLRTK
jgi:hypothetical protein